MTDICSDMQTSSKQKAGFHRISRRLEVNLQVQHRPKQKQSHQQITRHPLLKQKNSQNGNQTETKTETKAEPTQEEIDAAWEETERTEATCTEDGKIVYTNSITGDTKEESIPAAGHDYEVTETADATCTEDGTNTYTCKVCGDTYEEAIPATGHTEGEWKVTKEAGLFSTGSKEVTCENVERYQTPRKSLRHVHCRLPQ